MPGRERAGAALNGLRGLGGRVGNGKLAWDPAGLRGRIVECVQALQPAWSNRDLEAISPYVSDELYAQCADNFDLLDERFQVDRIDGVRLETAAPETMAFGENGAADCFVARVVFIARVWLEDLRTGQVLEGDRHSARRFTQRWAFVRESGGWVVDAVEQVAVEPLDRWSSAAPPAGQRGRAPAPRPGVRDGLVPALVLLALGALVWLGIVIGRGTVSDSEQAARARAQAQRQAQAAAQRQASAAAQARGYAAGLAAGRADGTRRGRAAGSADGQAEANRRAAAAAATAAASRSRATRTPGTSSTTPASGTSSTGTFGPTPGGTAGTGTSGTR
jgi:Tim44-like domain